MIALICLAVLGILVLYLGFLKNNKVLLPVAISGLFVVLFFNIAGWNNPVSYFNNMMLPDNYSIVFSTVIIISNILILLMAGQYFRGVSNNVAEVYCLMLFSLFGALLMTSFSNLIMLFLGIEIMTIPLYVLAGSKKFSIRSNEASFKYFVMGSFATAIFLLGVVLVYGACGSFNISAINEYFTNGKIVIPSFFYLGIMLLLIGMSFKVAAAPFHFWAPDVYEGSPTLITAFMATVVKTAGLAAFYKLFVTAFPALGDQWKPVLIGITIFTLLIGNVGAMRQTNMKRFLAFSSIAHTGFMLIAIVASDLFSANALLFYSVAYTLATLTVFGILILVKNTKGADGSFDAFIGLARNNPYFSVMMLVAMLSLAGIPVTAGFFAKYYVFVAAIYSGYTWLVVVAVVFALIGIYNYFRVVQAIYSKEGETPKIGCDLAYSIALFITTLLTIILGILPMWLMNLLQ
jgi:NADH-quinone oxidoreductase subunit N